MLPQYMAQLDLERQEVFKKLKSFSSQFVLAGGTAIMLQIGHRQSFDFDCFCQEEKLSANLLTKIKKVFGSFKIIFESSEILTIKTDKEIDISFVAHPFKILRPVIKTSSISLFHLDDLVANKAYTIGRRNTWRDYVDLFFFLKWRFYSIEKIIDLAKEKFEGEFNERLFLGQLVYFDDIKILPTIFLKESYTNDEIKAFLEKEVETYIRKTLTETEAK
mgnify:FL=1